MRWCDECQLPITECDENCPGRMEREYNKALQEWEMSPDFVEGVVE